MTVPTLPPDGVETVKTASSSRPGLSMIVALSWLTIVVVAAIAAPVIRPEGPIVQNIGEGLQLPSLAHPLGTDSFGRDMLARILYGAQPALLGVAIAVFVAVTVGSAAGLAGGYLRGIGDRVLSVIADLLMSLPLLLILLAVFAVFPNNIAIVMAIFGLFSSAAVYRIVRGATLTITEELYVTAAKSTGLSDFQIVTRHLAPRLWGLIWVQVSVIAAIALAIEVGLGFLGLDVTPPDPSWGSLISEGFRYFTSSPWLIVPPSVAIVLTILAFGVIGDGRQPPRSKRRTRGKGAQSSEGQSNRAVEPDVLLSVRGLTVRTGTPDGTALVEDVSFDVRTGEVVGLVGESGAGKSVTARALTRLDRNSTVSGSVVFDHTELMDLSESGLGKYRGSQIAFIGQDPMSALDPLFRIKSQLAEALRVHRGLSRRAAQAEAVELLRIVRIPEPEVVARKYPFEVSGGMAQRVAIALALAGEPRLLIADEPTTALDVTVQMEVLGLLKTLQRERGLAILFVTHDWGVIADICDRALTMYAGEVVETGDVQSIFATPSHPYTAALRHADPHLQDQDTRLRPISGTVPAPGDRPPHCRFADRCSLVTDACRAMHPPLTPLESGGTSRCIRAEELRTGAIHV